MDKVTSVRFTDLPKDSPYVKPFRLYYTQNGVEKNWDLLKVHDSVCVILFNVPHQKLIVVKQFRPAVYYGMICGDLNESNEGKIDLSKYPPKQACTLEMCAGIVDKDLPLIEIAREEILEECGYKVSVDRIEEVMRYRSGVGATGALQVLFYCEVTDDDKVSGGGGVEDEIIEVVELSIDDAKKMMEQGSSHTSPPSFLFAMLWFLTHKAPKN